MSTLNREESLPFNSNSFTWSLHTSLTLDKNWTVSNIASMITINVSKIIAMTSRKRRLWLSAETLMYAIKKLILRDPRATKRLQDSLFRKGKVLQSSWILAGSIPLGKFTQIQSSTLGGAWELEEEPRTSDGDSITSLLTKNQSIKWRIRSSTTIYSGVTIALLSLASSSNDLKMKFMQSINSFLRIIPPILRSSSFQR